MNRCGLIFALCLLGLGIGTAPVTARERGARPERWVYFGTHGSGVGQGVYAARFDPATGMLSEPALAAEIDRPTWLIPGVNRQIIYSVSETGNDGKSEASVYALASDPKSGKLSTVSKVGSGGGGATHLELDPRSRSLFVANYGTGQVSVLPVAADGSLGPVVSVQSDYGTGPHRRQTAPHAHGVALAPGGRFLLVTDLGADRTFVYRFDTRTRSLLPNDPPFAVAPAGSGPRHSAFLPNGRFVYVNSELTGEVTAYRWNSFAGQMTSIQTIAAQAPTYTGERSSAELRASRDGRFVYVSNRGEDSLVVFRVNRTTGELSEIQRLPSGGQAPWSFTIDPTGRWMLVANEASSAITVFRIDPTTGRVTYTSESVTVPKPVSVAFPRE